MTKIRNYLKVPIHIHPKIYIRDKSFYDTHHIYFLGEAPNCRYITNRTFVVKPPGNPVVAIYFHKFRLRFVLAVSVPITKQRRPIPIAGQLGNKQKRQTFQIARRNQTTYFPGFGIYFNPTPPCAKPSWASRPSIFPSSASTSARSRAGRSGRPRAGAISAALSSRCSPAA